MIYIFSVYVNREVFLLYTCLVTQYTCVSIPVCIREEPGHEPDHSITFKLCALETRLDYMGSSVLMARLSELHVKLADEWRVADNERLTPQPLATSRSVPPTSGNKDFNVTRQSTYPYHKALITSKSELPQNLHVHPTNPLQAVGYCYWATRMSVTHIHDYQPISFIR